MVRDGFKQAAALPCRFNNPGKHDSALQESLLSLFGSPSLLANDKYLKNSFPSRK